MSRSADALQAALARIGRWVLRSLHAGGLLLAAYVVGPIWVGYMLLPAIAVLLTTALAAAVRSRRLPAVPAYAASTFILVLAGLAASHAWSAEWRYLLALAARGSLGPVGAEEEHAVICAGLAAAIGAMLAAVAAGRRDLWGAFAWFVWCYWSISIVGRVAGLSESAHHAYDAYHNVFVSLPTGAVVGASVAVAVVLVVALSRRAARRRLA